MKKTFLLMVGASLLAASANAAIILIDNFSTSQTVQVTGGSSPPDASANNGVLTGANSIGGARNLTLTRTAGTGTDESKVNSGLFPTVDILEFSVAANDVANLLALYDGGTDNTNSHGLAASILPSGLNPRMEFLSRSDLSGTVTVTVYSGAANFSTGSFNLPALGFGATPFTLNSILYSSFVTGGGTGANFGSVSAITISISGSSGLDAQLDVLQARTDDDDTPEIPEPATTALVGAGLVAIYWARRRR